MGCVSLHIKQVAPCACENGMTARESICFCVVTASPSLEILETPYAISAIKQDPCGASNYPALTGIHSPFLKQ